jgi:hypothetical protein
MNLIRRSPQSHFDVLCPTVFCRIPQRSRPANIPGLRLPGAGHHETTQQSQSQPASLEGDRWSHQPSHARQVLDPAARHQDGRSRSSGAPHGAPGDRTNAAPPQPAASADLMHPAIQAEIDRLRAEIARLADRQSDLAQQGCSAPTRPRRRRKTDSGDPTEVIFHLRRPAKNLISFPNRTA